MFLSLYDIPLCGRFNNQSSAHNNEHISYRCRFFDFFFDNRKPKFQYEFHQFKGKIIFPVLVDFQQSFLIRI